MRGRRLLALVVAAAILPGCLGYSYLGTTIVDETASTTTAPDRPRRTFGSQTDADLLLRFGEPDERVATPTAGEAWVYHDGWRWNGPVLFVVIPLPLVVPVGHESTTYHLRDGVVERVVSVEQSLDGHVCGWVGHTLGCRALGP